jgi:hypothetical protein
MFCKNCGKEIRLWVKGGQLYVHDEDVHDEDVHDTVCPLYDGTPYAGGLFESPHIPMTETDIAKRILKIYE